MTKQVFVLLIALGSGCNGVAASIDAGAELGGASAVAGHSGIGGHSTVTLGGMSSLGGAASIGGHFAPGGYSGTVLATTQNPYDAGFSLGVTTPGVVPCGNSTCPALSHTQQNVDTESYCCILGPSTGDPYRQTCYRNANLGACESGVPVYCDDAADCDTGLVCCVFDGRELFSCQADCGTRTQLCRTDAECRNGKKCSGTVTIDGWVDGVCK